MPLRLRLALLFAAATAVLIALAGLAFILQLRVSVDASLDPGLRARVAALGDELDDELDSDGALPPLGTTDTLVQARTPTGQLLAATPEAGSRDLLDAAQFQQALGGEVSFTSTVNGERSRILATTISTPSGPVMLTVGVETDVSDAAVDRAVSALLLGGPPAALLAGLGAWLLAGATLRPVERMRRQAADISDQDLDQRLAVPATRDEVAALAITINDLLSRLGEALDRERGFVADAGHELRTPLAILRTELELAARPGRTREALADAVAQAGQETDRLIRLAEDLLLLARADNRQPFLRPVPLSLPDLLEAAARGARARAEARSVEVVVDCPPELDIEADPDRLRQAVDNLLDNASRHAPDGSTVDVTASVLREGVIAVDVTDRGAGFPPEFLPQAFDRFRRAEASRARDSGGSGLGLAIVRAVAQAHGGTASATNRQAGGAAVRIVIPRSPHPHHRHDDALRSTVRR
jgi:two-component system OmpR family sensor kinase